MHFSTLQTQTEIAVSAESGENRCKLLPVRLVDMRKIEQWSWFDIGTGRDLALALREYHILDFSNWQNIDFFEAAFERLLSDLKID